MPAAPSRRAVTALVTATALALATAACGSGSTLSSAEGSVITSF
jgi:zinc transport system substrate-binding protein